METVIQQTKILLMIVALLSFPINTEKSGFCGTYENKRYA